MPPFLAEKPIPEVKTMVEAYIQAMDAGVSTELLQAAWRLSDGDSLSLAAFIRDHRRVADLLLTVEAISI